MKKRERESNGHNEVVSSKLKQDYSSFIDKYEYRLFYSEEDEGYIATIAELPNCSAFGDDPLEALQEAKKAASLYIEYFLEKEVEVPEPFSLRNYSGKFNVRIPPDLHRKLSRESALQNLSLNTLISSVLSNYVCRK